MAFDGQNEIRINECDWECLLARVARLERANLELTEYVGQLALANGLSLDGLSLESAEIVDKEVAGDSENDLAPKLIAWLCGKAPIEMNFLDG